MPKAREKLGLRLTQVAEHEWVFDDSDRSDRDLDRFDMAIELLDTDAEKAARELRALLKSNQNDLDVRHHLAIALSILGRNEEAFDEWRRAVEIGWKAIPDAFYFGLDRLEWMWLENRPFLRAYRALADALLAEGLVGEAVTILRNILDLNPRDNQGVRMTLASCWFGLRRPGEVLRLKERFPDVIDPDLMFGRALALYQLGRKDEASVAYAEAAETSPRVHAELLKSRHTQPVSEMPGYVTIGGADEAFLYWEEFGQYWKATRGALAMARRHGKAE